MILWSSLGWKEEVDTELEARRIVKEAKEYEQQKITLSWTEDGQQQNKVLYNGLDDQKKEGWLDMIRQARELERKDLDNDF